MNLSIINSFNKLLVSLSLQLSPPVNRFLRFTPNIWFFELNHILLFLQLLNLSYCWSNFLSTADLKNLRSGTSTSSWIATAILNVFNVFYRYILNCYWTQMQLYMIIEKRYNCYCRQCYLFNFYSEDAKFFKSNKKSYKTSYLKSIRFL